MHVEEMRALVAGAPVARLGTIDPDGRPNLVPFVFSLDGDELFSVVDRKPKRTTGLRRVQNLMRDPRATVLVDHYSGDWDDLWWVRLRGRGRIAYEGADVSRARDLLNRKYPQYAAVEQEEIALVIRIDEWRGWRATQR